MQTEIRRERTKRDLAEALKQCMSKKPFTKITIRELTEICGIRRQSFYYHFEDIYALLKWTLHQETLIHIKNHENMLIWQEGVLDLFQYAAENRSQCICIMDSVGREYLEQFFYDDLSALFEKAVLSYAEILEPHSLDIKYARFLMHYYCISLIGVLETWIYGKIKETPDEVVSFFDRMVQDQIRGIVSRNLTEEDAAAEG